MTRSPPNRAYRRLQLFFAVFCILYVAGPTAGILFVPGFRGEVFPVGAWLMFCKVQNVVHDYGLELYEDGRWVEVERLADDRWFTIDLYFLVNAYGRVAVSVERGRAAELYNDLNASLPRKLTGRRVRLVRRSWKPLDRWRDGVMLQHRVVKEWTLE